MRVPALFLFSLFIISIFHFHPSSAQYDKTFHVTGAAHCSDCQSSNFKLDQAFSGLHVSVDCKLQNGDMKRFAVSPLSDDGQFHVSIPGDIVDHSRKSLKHDCFAQLHSASAVPCPNVDPLGAKIVFKSDKDGKYVFAPNKKLDFTAALCTSKFLWPHFKYPPLPTTHPWLKNFGHPWTYKHPFFKKPPVVQPQPPPVPVYIPPPTVKPTPPTISKPPTVKPKTPTISKPPKKPCPPTKPKPKPKPPVVYKPPKKPCPPKAKPPVIVKPPVVVKPLPPPVPIVKPIVKPPFYKKPCPPLPPFPKFPPKSYFKHPLLPKFPPKPYFKHPKFPVLPPHLP